MTPSLHLVLVTGGAGYIGSVVTEQLLRAGHRVRVLDRFSFGGGALLPLLHHPDLDIRTGDIRDQAAVTTAMIDVDTVVHLAAIVGDPACAKFPDEAMTVNRAGSELLCLAAMDAGVRRFIFASTCSNYGKMSDHDGYVDEQSPLGPISLYAELKVGFEQFLMAQSKSGFEPVCLRFATAYGMSGRPRFDLTVNEFTRELLLGRTLQIFGQQFWRPYCHVVDIASACRLAVEASTETVARQAINVGVTSENYQKKRLVELISDQIGDRAGKIEFVARQEDPRDYRVNFDKIERLLSFSAQWRVPDGIREIIAAISGGLVPDPDLPAYRNV